MNCINRLIIIGNGFDLAHGLPTRYEDFINWYWDQWVGKLKGCHNRTAYDGLCTFTLKSHSSAWSNFLLVNRLKHNPSQGLDLVQFIKNNKDYFSFKLNPFMEIINHAVETKGWVDIENLYYERLCSCTKDKDYESVNLLNQEMDILKSLLAEYLESIQTQVSLNTDIKRIIYTPFAYKEIAISDNKLWNNMIVDRYNSIDRLLDEDGEYYQLLQIYENVIDLKAQYDYYKQLIENDKDFIYYMGIDSYNPEDIPEYLLLPQKTMILNFNYTNTVDMYIEAGEELFESNHIHGELSNSDSIIFGYGDELDEKYKKILNLNNNSYLHNIKSIKYLETPNYRKMLSFIESAPFQVFILGHSCGNSDRTLLNTIFEHKNCISIKPYYHQKEDGSDNYMEIVQNISRNFTDMKLMRNRVVNKTYCEPLPQNK